jgi:26S proteasome regulatory subunit N8
MVGFYSTGPKIRGNDLKISGLFRQFCAAEPVFVIIDVRVGLQGIPTTAYEAVEEVQSEGKEIQRVFKHIGCSIEAEEAEEVGVEHLLRDINDPSTSVLALQIKEKVNSLGGLMGRLQEIRDYLEAVIAGKAPINNQIVYNLQNIFNLVPNLNVDELVKSMLVTTNDMHLVMYLSSLVRSVIALHELLANKMKYRDIDDVLDKSAGVVEASADSDKKAAEKDKVGKEKEKVDAEAASEDK